jgi:hypothetical protein
MWTRLALIFAALTAFPGPLRAQYSVPSQASSSDSTRLQIARDEPSEFTEEPIPWELGGSLNFVTSEPSLGGEELKFTDVMLLRLHSLVTPTEGLNVFAGVDILPKQPSYTNEHPWQGALLGARWVLDENFAVWARGTGGPLLDRQGYWLSGAMAGQFRLSLEKTLFFESALGSNYSQLFYDTNTDKPFVLAEIFTEIGLALRDRHEDFGLWLRFDYYYPVAGHPNLDFPDPTTGLALDPQPRVNFHLGALVSVTRKLALFLEWSILDRGDLEDPATTLPVLNRGFDQQQLVFGFMRRFGRGTRRR